MEAERGHVGFGPSVAALLDVLLEFDPPGRLLPLELAVLALQQLLHLGEDRVWLVAGVAVVVLAQDELHPLGRRSDCNHQQKH